MGQTDLAAEFFELYLPPDVAALLDFSSLTTCKEVFVDEELQEHLSDLLFQAHTKTGRRAYVHLLLEHKSAPDKWVSLQILRYQTLLWHDLQRNGVTELPYIVPVVCYHGRSRWRVSDKFSALFGTHEETALLRQYVAEFRYHLCDLTRYEDAEINGPPALQTGLRLLKYAFRKSRLRQQLVAIWSLLLTSDFPEARLATFIHVCSKYLQHGPKLSTAEVKQAFTIAAEAGDPKMETFVDEWINKGKQQGLQQGLQQGQKQGQQQVAYRLALRALHKRFSDLPQDIEANLAQLATPDLEDLAIAVFDWQDPAELHQWLQQKSPPESVN